MFRWGFIGSRGIAITIANEIFKNKGMAISAVYSRNFIHAKEFSKKYNAIPYMSFEKMIKDRLFDALYIATPHRFHFHYAKIALENKIPVLCEKPITLSLDSSRELFKIAKENDTYFAEAMWIWFNPTANVVKSWIDQGKIGDVKQMDADFTVPSYLSMKQRLFDNKLGGGSLFDLGVYPVSYAYRLFGCPDEIVSKAIFKKDIDLSCKITFKYKNGVVCNLSCGFTSFGKCDVKITGSKGIIKVPPMFHSARKAKIMDKNPCKYIDSEKIGLYEREFVLTSKEILEGKKISNYVTDVDSLCVMKIMEEIKSQIGLRYPDDKE